MTLTKFCSAMTCVLVVASLAVAQDKSQEEATIKSSLSNDGTATPCFGACKINFRQELKVPFDFLDSLGSEIHEARKLPDPVALAAAARNLAVAETVAGKAAAVTSEDVMNEAVELAKLRGELLELKAISLLVSDKKLSNELKRIVAAAEDKQPEEGETTRELNGDLIVENHTHHDLRIMMDGRYLGIVHRGRTRSFHVHNHNWHNHFDAYCADDGALIRHANYQGHAHRLNWHIHE